MNALNEGISSSDFLCLMVFMMILAYFLYRDKTSNDKDKTNRYDKEFDPMYKEFENSLRVLYKYPDIYVKPKIKSRWYVHSINPETRSPQDVKWFIEFSRKVINDYPNSYIFTNDDNTDTNISVDKLDDTTLTHPLNLFIWRKDVKHINNRARESEIDNSGTNPLNILNLFNHTSHSNKQ
jgi:hypothetical protein